MSETKTFDSAAVASLTTGILLVEVSLFKEVAEYILGHGIFTHQYPSLADSIKAKALEQFPEMPTEVGAEGWERLRDKVRADFGDAVEVKRGNGEAIEPLDPAHMPKQWLG